MQGAQQVVGRETADGLAADARRSVDQDGLRTIGPVHEVLDRHLRARLEHKLALLHALA